MAVKHVSAVRGRGALGLGRGLSAVIGEPPPPPPPVPGAGWDGTQSPTGRNPLFIASSARQDNWALWKANYDANPSAPSDLGGKLYGGIKYAADLGTYYIDLGQWDSYLFQITGNPTYAQRSYAKVRGWAVVGQALVADPNSYREWGGYLTIIYDWIYPGLTADQRAEFYQCLRDAAVYYYTNYAGGWATLMVSGDSDQILGHWLNLALLYLVDPTNVTVAAMWNDPATGGWTPTASNHTSTGRNAIYQYATELALGGEWCESTGYNVGTMHTVLPEMEAIRTATGEDKFPEYTALLPDLGRSFMAKWTPDLNARYAWGDDEHKFDDRLLYEFSQDAMIIAGIRSGTLISEQLQQFIADMIAKYGFTVNNQSTFYPNILGGWIMYNPYAPAQTWKTTVAPYNNKIFYAAGKGLLNYKTGFTAGDSLFSIDSGQRLTDSLQGNWWVNHLVEYVMSCELYGKGEWLLTYPEGYNSGNIRGIGTNCPLMHGFNGCWEFRRVVQVAYTDTYASVSLTMGGSLQDKYYDQPNDLVAVHEWTRDLVFIPGLTDVVICCDRANLVPINDVNSYNVGMTYSAPRTRITGGATPVWDGPYVVTAPLNAKQIVWHTSAAPTVSGQTVSWTTAGGHAMKLTQVFPATTNFVVRSEAAMQAAAEFDFAGADSRYLAHHVVVYPTNTQQWDLFLGVIYAAGTAGTLVAKTDGTSKGVHGTRPGQDDFLVVFNGAQGTTLNSTPHHASHNAVLAVTRLRATGFTHSWTAVGSNTIVILNHLDPAHSWTIDIDSAGPVTLAVDTQGHVMVTVSGSGAHTIVVA